MSCHFGKSGVVIYCTGNLHNLTVSKIDRANREVPKKKRKQRDTTEEYDIELEDKE